MTYQEALQKDVPDFGFVISHVEKTMGRRLTEIEKNFIRGNCVVSAKLGKGCVATLEKYGIKLDKETAGKE